MAEEESLQTFYFDRNRTPICPQYLVEESAECQDCLFSHSDAAYYNYLQVPGSLLEDSAELFNFLISYGLANPDSFIEVEREEAEKQFQQDIEELSNLVSEMKSFEMTLKDQKCPFRAETGNCLLATHCMYACENKQKEWYPESRNCECCRGHKYGCNDQGCRKSDICQKCLTV